MTQTLGIIIVATASLAASCILNLIAYLIKKRQRRKQRDEQMFKYFLHKALQLNAQMELEEIFFEEDIK